MNNILILFIALIILFTVTSYVITTNIISTLIIGIITLIYFLLIAYPIVKKYLDASHRFHSCFTFINSFIVSLSVKGSLLAAFDYIKLNMDQDYIDISEGLLNLKEEEKLDYLKKYFNFDIYYLFLSVVNIYIEQGGDILNLSSYLINEARRSEDYLIKVESYSKHKIVDFSLLWIFTLIILIILRFSLASFYPLISSKLFFQIIIGVIYLLILASIQLLIMRVTKKDIKGFNNVN